MRAGLEVTTTMMQLTGGMKMSCFSKGKNATDFFFLYKLVFGLPNDQRVFSLFTFYIMGLLDVVPAGVVTGDNLRKLFEYGKSSLQS